MFTLEKYSGSGSRYTCCRCAAKKKFVRYIDETGKYLADHVGRCDRESSCGYHYKPKDYYAENPSATGSGTRNGPLNSPGLRGQCGSNLSSGEKSIKPLTDRIDNIHLLNSRKNYDQNAFSRFLYNLFPSDAEDVTKALNEYKIGTGRNGEAIFWQIDGNAAIRTGKLITYDAATGKRLKDVTPNWVHAELKKSGQLPDSFELQQCFFGEHLLEKYPDLAVAIVEAEKTAVIASICKRVFPQFIWLACGGKANLKVASLARLGWERTIVIYPDADGFEKWQQIASDASERGQKVIVSDLIERLATDAEKAKGFDLADYLIGLQMRRNDPSIRAAFAEMIEEWLAIMKIEGQLTDKEAEGLLENSGFMEYAERLVLG